MKDLKIKISTDWFTVGVGRVEGTIFAFQGRAEIHETLRLVYAAYVAHLGGVCGFTFEVFVAHIHGVLVAANWDGASRLLVSEVA